MSRLNEIQPHTPVVCSDNFELATVDELEGPYLIKVTKDANGLQHFIPTAWVTSVDDKVHLDRPGDQAMRDWLECQRMLTQ